MTEKKELRQRVDAEKKELQARLAQLKVKGTAAANDQAEKIEGELQDLENSLREGWDNLSEKAARKLNDWLDRNKAA